MNNKPEQRDMWKNGSSTSTPRPVNNGKRVFPKDTRTEEEIMKHFYENGFC